jgi:hypothetical protein
MIARYDIEQGSEDWHKIKHGKIGGTRAKQLFVNSETLLNDLLSEICEEFDLQEGFQNFDMQRGTELEPEARKYLSKYLSVELLECGYLQHSEIDILGISPDGISKCETISAEIKCFASKKHIEIIRSNEIPTEHICQNLQYFLVNPKLEKHYFISYRPENLYKVAFIQEFTRDTLIDIGWTKKGKIKEDRGLGIKEYVTTEPDVKTVAEWIEIMRINAIYLQENIDLEIEKLKF